MRTRMSGGVRGGAGDPLPLLDSSFGPFSFVARTGQRCCCAICPLTHLRKLSITATTQTRTGKSTLHPWLVRELDGGCCESDPIAEVEWSPELHGQNRSRVAQAGAATVIRAESIIVKGAGLAPKTSYSQSEAGPLNLSLSPAGFCFTRQSA
jgi:hypothetical protein